MPAIGLVQDTIANGAAGFVVVGGRLSGIDTSVTEVWAENAPLYVETDNTTTATTDCGETLTETKPTGTGELVQAVARVVRVNASLGEVLVIGAGRSNDIPNDLTVGRSGAGDTINTDTVSLDNTWAGAQLESGVVLDSESPAAGDISGDFATGLTIDAEAVAVTQLDDGGAATTAALFAGAAGDPSYRAIVDGDVPNTITIDHSTSGTLTLDADDPTTNEGRIGWDSGNNRIRVGEAGGVVTFYSGDHIPDTTCSDAACTVGTDDTITIEGGTTITAIADDEFVIGSGANAITFVPGPTGGTNGCSGATTDKMLYNSTTNTLSCGTDQGGSETNSLETVMTGALSGEIPIGTTAGGVAAYVSLQACAADEKLEYTDGTPDTMTCEAIGSLVDADITFTSPNIAAATATTPSVDNDSTLVATTAFVQDETAAAGDISGTLGTGFSYGTSNIDGDNLTATVAGGHLTLDTAATPDEIDIDTEAITHSFSFVLERGDYPQLLVRAGRPSSR
jgi:hypothetical protein